MRKRTISRPRTSRHPFAAVYAGSPAPDAGQKNPLVGMGLNFVAQENAVASFAGRFLQRERDRVAETASWERVLIGKRA